MNRTLSTVITAAAVAVLIGYVWITILWYPTEPQDTDWPYRNASYGQPEP